MSGASFERLLVPVTIPPSNGRASITSDVKAALVPSAITEPHRASATVGPWPNRPEREPQTAGELIRFWRTQRRLTQMEMALDAHLSTKHLSFVETGRSHPSRSFSSTSRNTSTCRSPNATACCSLEASLRPTWSSPSTAR